MDRSKFIKISTLGIASSLSVPNIWMNNLMANPSSKSPLFYALLKSNDKLVEGILSNVSDRNMFIRSRASVGEFAVISASCCVKESRYYNSEEALKRMDEIIDSLSEQQYPDGTLDSGGNRQSPPDTAFRVEYLAPAATLLMQLDSGRADSVKNKLSVFLKKVGEGLITGGVHTPNHRWVVSAALARLYVLFNDERYIKRIDEWLAEGVYIDEDGQFPERSRNYAAVEDGSLMMIGHILNRPELFEAVKKNLLANYYYMEDNGELITVDSRRQDQNFLVSISRFYLFYRFFAIQFKDEFFAAIVRKMESLPHIQKRVIGRSFLHFLYVPVLFEEIPEGGSLPTNYTKVFPLTHLVRIKRGNRTATIFGGNDRPIIIASGRSTNPSFFTYRKGKAILDYVRLSTAFFRTGYFRSQGVTANGNTYKLQETREAYYFQPMSVENRDPEGDYELSLSPDRRFWSKMGFDSREKSNIQVLETHINIHEKDGEFEMEIDVSGPESVEVVLELCFRKGGELENVVSTDNSEDFLLAEGYGRYTMENDTIRFGPGKAGHDYVERIDGELYSTHFGSIKGDGNHVYLTGHTPFKHKLSIG